MNRPKYRRCSGSRRPLRRASSKPDPTAPVVVNPPLYRVPREGHNSSERVTKGGNMAEQQAEQTFIENPFGTVTNKRVIYYRAKGWFSGGSREDIPLQHVTSVRLDITR